MIEINIPGFRHLQLAHLVLDYNGTLAIDGHLIPQVGKKLTKLSHDLHIHVLTADTFGLAKTGLAGLPLDLAIAPPPKIRPKRSGPLLSIWVRNR
ncbi:MAG: hypothetical protein ACOYM4_05230 [Nodosilinea sp.]